MSTPSLFFKAVPSFGFATFLLHMSRLESNLCWWNLTWMEMIRLFPKRKVASPIFLLWINFLDYESYGRKKIEKWVKWLRGVRKLWEGKIGHKQMVFRMWRMGWKNAIILRELECQTTRQGLNFICKTNSLKNGGGPQSGLSG